MKLRMTVDTGDGPQEVITNLWAVVQWERKYKTKASNMGQGVGMEDLAYLAYESLKTTGHVVPVVFDDFLKRLVSLDVHEQDGNPTQGAPTAER